MSLTYLLLLAAALFCIGLFGLLTRRHLIAMLLSVELMLNSANINFIAFARYGSGDPTSGALFSIFVVAVAAAEMAVALAILIAMYRRRHQLDADLLSGLNG
jgi:NADH:ubiquinone oxidoreductase subunit K